MAIMNLSAPFIARPVATTLLTVGVLLSGIVAFRLLPVAPLPQVDFPTINVSAKLPGASPETMAATVATPLERALGHIAGVTEMTSNSSLGTTQITLQFDLDRNIDGAARDVQAGIDAARTLLPTGLPSNPTYRKSNPADAPIMIMALTSKTMTQGQLYDAASTILSQKISQVFGIGQVTVGGSSLPAVRIELNPDAMNKYGISLEQARTAIAATNPNRPKGIIEFNGTRWQIYANDQANRAKDYLPLILAYNNGAPVRVSDVGTAVDSVQDVRNAGSANGTPSVLLIIFKQPGANIIETVDRVNALMPQLRHAIPQAIDLRVMMDRTPTIRSSLHDVERTLIISIALVIMVVFIFLRNGRATLIPSVAVPVSLVGTFGAMYLCSYSLDNLSLMALIIATGFVVDDAIVVLENISRHIEDGMKPVQAALKGAAEVGFTVFSMSLSLIAVFIPILLMKGILGRLFREFAVTLSTAILVSLVVSLTATPMMCALLLKRESDQKHGRFYNFSERAFNKLHRGYEYSLTWALDRKLFTMILLLFVVVLNVYLYVTVNKSFFPSQDTGRIGGSIQADQSISFQAMKHKLDDFMSIIGKDPAVDNVVGFIGGGQTNTGRMFITLKARADRDVSADEVIDRVRGKLAKEPGAKLILQSQQDIRMGGRQSNATYQYTLQADDLSELRAWAPKLYEALVPVPELADVNTDQQDKGLQTSLVFDRDTLYKLGLSLNTVDSTLNDAYGQRQISTIYNPLNQYHVVMEVDPKYWQSSDSLGTTYVTTTAGAEVPLAAFSTYGPTSTPLAVNHQGQFAAATISFNLPPGISLGEASNAITKTTRQIGMPDTVQGTFQGTAKAFQDSLGSQDMLIAVAILTIYIVLGMLYESYIHPVTILSTLPSAGVGAILALMITHTDFTMIAFIGVILLIGIVKKNAIMMIDFAIDAERRRDLSPHDAIFEACLMRFRPILMTTMAALLGALPLALGAGDGAELRQPLGISIVGGLIVSQMLTLYTTPVVYLYLDSFRIWWKHNTWRKRADALPRVLLVLLCILVLVLIFLGLIYAFDFIATPVYHSINGVLHAYFHPAAHY
jgi:multidrug efflux pump